jgi:hypothetical protein
VLDRVALPASAVFIKKTTSTRSKVGTSLIRSSVPDAISAYVPDGSAQNPDVQGYPEPYSYRYIRCTYGSFSREITIHRVIYGADIRFWPNLQMFSNGCKVSTKLRLNKNVC